MNKTVENFKIYVTKILKKMKNNRVVCYKLNMFVCLYNTLQRGKTITARFKNKEAEAHFIKNST